jgi:parallel beta-helix repeat protein
VIKDLTITGDWSGNGILIENSYVYFIIEHCSIHDKETAIWLQRTKNGQLIDNDCSYNSRNGIVVNYGENNKVIGNTINENWEAGISMNFGVDNIISDNIVNNNHGWGMFIMECDRSTVTGNIVNDNTQVGILIESNQGTTEKNIVSGNNVNNNGWNGMYLARCRDSTISGNNLEYNEHSGIQLCLSDLNEVSENEVHYSPAGIGLDRSNYNLICSNNLLNNYLCISESSDCIGNVIIDNECLDPIWRRDIQIGDILLSRNEGWLSLAGLFWTHAGIYVGNDKVVEARRDVDGGISDYYISDWDFPNETYVSLLRVVSASSEQRIAAAQWAFQQAKREGENKPIYTLNIVGKSYDPSEPNWYCSELVWAAYYNQDIDIDIDDVEGVVVTRNSVSPDDIYLDADTMDIHGHREEFLDGGEGISIISYSPVDLVVIDPNNLCRSKEIAEIPESYYIESDIDRDGSFEDIILIPEKKIGEYLITVIPEFGTHPTDTYTLEVSADGITKILADNIQIDEIPNQPYIISSTETEIIPIIPATVDFDPNTLNLQSSGKWVTVYIELPIGHGYDISEIDISSILLNDQINAKLTPNEIGDYDLDGIPDLMVKFDLFDVQEKLQVGEEVTIIITGIIEDEKAFRGKDTIRIISHEEIVYSQIISSPSLISVNSLTVQLVALIGIAITLVILPKKRISSKF